MKKLYLLIIAGVLLAFTSFPLLHSLSDGEILYCANQNMTLASCLSFWSDIYGVIGNQTCPICNVTNCTNTTIIKEINNTIIQDKNCSDTIEYKKAEWEYELEKQRINKNCTETECPVLNCDKECEEKVLAIKQQYSTPASSSKDFSDYFPYIAGGVLVLGGLWYYNNHKKSKTLIPPVSPVPDYQPKTKEVQDGEEWS